MLLKHYTATVGREIDIITGLSNAGVAIEWLTALTKLITEQGFFDDTLTYVFQYRQSRNLDGWLINRMGGSVDPLELHVQMQEQLLLLEAAYNAVSDKQLKNYYQPKLPILLQDVYAIQEGLLTAAINI